MCSVNDSGNPVLQKILWCDTVYIGRILPPLKFTALNSLLVFGDGILRPHHLGRRCREFKSGLASIMKITPCQPSRSRTCEHSTSGGTGFGKPTRHNSRFIHCYEVICEKYTQHCPCTTGIQQCVCVHVMEVHKT